MTLVRWNPWTEIDALQRQFDRMFDTTTSSFPVALRDLNNAVKFPAAELTQADEALHLKLEVPGMEPNDLDIEVTENMVSIRGERKEESQTEENGKTHSEFHYGQFHRVIPLPSRIENTNVTAEYKDGILHLTLPKTTAEKNKVVKIKLDEATA
ncbi:Hsp20/alpha crystallin family protein [Oscillatoriales cyanobacterium LEGE 11467]|uniref:Hsp20/alpha crystallin family protein n=1 Tax=Zarconia navalis LEGE 11467 TaxID=1828826 RepID=A0A928ZBC2_9CYAN|nr:Hsp20/alpha crystallin family protein [Zarconia navalis]MBE9042521.1 Hsp20/alpha crystallin family protein [Zarconia navalis LEGE 11467]